MLFSQVLAFYIKTGLQSRKKEKSELSSAGIVYVCRLTCKLASHWLTPQEADVSIELDFELLQIIT